MWHVSGSAPANAGKGFFWYLQGGFLAVRGLKMAVNQR